MRSTNISTEGVSYREGKCKDHDTSMDLAFFLFLEDIGCLKVRETGREVATSGGSQQLEEPN